MKKRILVISGSPKAGSFSESLAMSYQAGASKDHDVQLCLLSAMTFNPDLSQGYAQVQPLEDCLEHFQQQLSWAEHLVVYSPVWWGGLPAKFKGLFDRTFLPGFAFRYEKGMTMQQKLLRGKTASLILTMDTPPWYFRWWQGAPAMKQLKITTLAFCGIQTLRQQMLGPMISASEVQKADWLTQAKLHGEQGK
ncbi:NAD(P)H-dependent oxidoreductase [Bowmanella pacifica]|uniref:NAD(P)H dehydrogenase n=1 Tax=Bowmanella pacifica TaxID=502051 RepID=A0A917YTT6_9ALTE|nr:NAD(P)H-dependent oxidoreductase [Bowmanella pacifica]GGO66032.1 NAD(P)H dehydrogenase [Bowmanella pacifica]